MGCFDRRQKDGWDGWDDGMELREVVKKKNLDVLVVFLFVG